MPHCENYYAVEWGESATIFSDYWNENEEHTDAICSEIQHHMPVIYYRALAGWFTWKKFQNNPNQE